MLARSKSRPSSCAQGHDRRSSSYIFKTDSPPEKQSSSLQALKNNFSIHRFSLSSHLLSVALLSILLLFAQNPSVVHSRSISPLATSSSHQHQQQQGVGQSRSQDSVQDRLQTTGKAHNLVYRCTIVV